MKNGNTTTIYHIYYQLYLMFVGYKLKQKLHNISLSLLSLTPWCFSLLMEAWLFKRRVNAGMTLYCRQVISRFDLRCSALLPLLRLLSLCRLLQWADPLVLEDSEGWLVEGQRSPSCPVQACLFPTARTPSPAISQPPSLFSQTCGLYQWDGWDIHRSI